MLTVVACIVLGSAISGYFLTGPRIARLMAEEGLAARWFGEVGAAGAPRFGTLWIAAVAIAFTLTNSFDELLVYTVPFMSATTALVAIGVLVQRVRAPQRPRPFRVRCVWVVVALQVVLGLALLVGFVRANPQAVAIDAGAAVVGLCLFPFVRAR